MTSPAETTRYTSVAIALHWVIAIAMAGLVGVGWYMSDLPDGAPGQQMLYQMHKSVGITVLLLTVARIGWRWMNPPPSLPDGMAPLEKTASHLVHLGFYGLMLALPLTGWLVASTSYEFQVPTVLFGLVSWPHLPFVEGLKNETGHGVAEFLHSKLAWVGIGLIVLHVAGAVKHEFSDEDGVLKRMIPGLFGKTSGPRAPGRGAATAFGAAAIVFALVAGTPLVANAVGGDADLTSSGAIDANWAVDYDASEIRFSGIHDGNEFSGVFEDWSSAIAYDPDAFETAAAEVTVDMGSAVTGTKLYDDSLDAAEWFNTSGFPSASVVMSDFVQAPEGYQATATLTLKEATVSAPFAFLVVIDGEEAEMTGSTTFSRAALDLGQQSDAGADWVSDEIKVDVTVKASRLN